MAIKSGTRVKLTKEYSAAHEFTVPSGEKGTVKSVNNDASVSVLMDKVIPNCAAEFDNCIIVDGFLFNDLFKKIKA